MDNSGFPTLAVVREAHPGELAVLLSGVSSDAVSGMDAAAAEAVVVATQRVSSWASGLPAVAVDRFAEHVIDAQEHHAIALVAARDAQRAELEEAGGVWRGDTGAVALPEPEQVAASMLAPELRISPRTMRTRLGRARALMELPRTLHLALAGELEPWRVDAVAIASRDVAADRLAELEARLYDSDVTSLPKPRLVERVRRATVKADPDSTTRGIHRAPGRRSLRVAPSDTAGLMRWSLEVPDDLSRRLLAAVDALAQEYLTADRHTDDRADHEPRGRRSVEAARLDALGDLVMANAQVQTVVELVVPVDAGTRTVTNRPDPRTAVITELSGTREPDELLVDLVLGTVTPATLDAGRVGRHLGLLLGQWVETTANPFVTDQRPPTKAPPGAALGAGPKPPACPPPEPIWFVDGLVEAPGASTLLPEHITALLAGDTVEANLQCLCAAHHGFKHHAGWTVTMTPDGTCRWTTPTGTTHTTIPSSTRDQAA